MGPYVWCYLLLVGSALLPWLNSEVIMASMAVLAPSHWGQVALVLIAAAGQMTGKCALYWVGRGVVKIPRAERKMESWSRKWKGGKAGGTAVLFLSSSLGMPPFYPVSVMAGGLRVPFGRFVAISGCGRLLHYGAVVFGTRLLWSVLG